MAFSQWEKQRLEKLLSHKKALEEQIARHEIRSERVLMLFTKANIDRMQKMAEAMNTSRNDLLNKLIEHAYLTGLYKEKLTIDEGSKTNLSPRRGVSFKKSTKTQAVAETSESSLWTKTDKSKTTKSKMPPNNASKAKDSSKHRTVRATKAKMS